LPFVIADISSISSPSHPTNKVGKGITPTHRAIAYLKFHADTRVVEHCKRKRRKGKKEGIGEKRKESKKK